MNKAETIKKSKENWERKPADHYATPYPVTWALCDWMIANDIMPHKNAFPTRKRNFSVLEPCCGKGHISRVLTEEYGLDVTSHDLHDYGYGESGVNYLIKPEKHPRLYEFSAVITNPPFSLAERFIRRAMRDAPIVAMLLPNDFWHAKTRAVFFRSRPPRAVLALTWRPAFLKLERGENPLSNFSWTVWDDRYDQITGRTEYDLLDKPE